MTKLGRPKKNAANVAAFARNLNQIKSDKGITNQQIAAALGIKNVQQLTYWTAGHGMPSPKNLERLAKVLQVKQSELTGKTIIEVMDAEGML